MKNESSRQFAWKRMFAGVALPLVLFLSGCQVQASMPAPAEVSIPAITIKTSEYAFEMPEQIEAGLVTITLENTGQEAHHVQLMQLNEGVTMEQLKATLRQDPLAALPLVIWSGGPGPVEPGGTQTVTVELEAGQYILICFLPGRDGVPHVTHGMVATFDVVETESAVTQAPDVDGEVTLLDFSFTLPQTIRSGAQIWKVSDRGKQPHELTLIKLVEGKTMVDVQQWLHEPAGPPPYIFAGGMQAIDPGQTAYLHLDLTPGNYVALCFVPDPASGKEHMELGMVMPFAVE